MNFGRNQHGDLYIYDFYDLLLYCKAIQRGLVVRAPDLKSVDHG